MNLNHVFLEVLGVRVDLQTFRALELDVIMLAHVHRNVW